PRVGCPLPLLASLPACKEFISLTRDYAPGSKSWDCLFPRPSLSLEKQLMPCKSALPSGLCAAATMQMPLWEKRPDCEPSLPLPVLPHKGGISTRFGVMPRDLCHSTENFTLSKEWAFKKPEWIWYMSYSCRKGENDVF